MRGEPQCRQTGFAVEAEAEMNVGAASVLMLEADEVERIRSGKTKRGSKAPADDGGYG